MTTPPEAAGIPSPNYTVLKDIPAGAWGPRFLAEDHRLGRKVHLHLLPPPASLAVGYLEQLRKDVEAVSRLNDMHLVRVYAMEEMGGRWILVAEPVDGETLDGRIRREGVVATDESTAIVIQVSRGLHYAHRQGVAHPGLRPSKVVMAGGLAKILDVGLTSLPGIPDETGA